jgi:hypothetical protein
MSVRPELADEVRQEAYAYVDAVLARAERRDGLRPETGPGEARRSLIVRLVPGALKRAIVRALIYLLRHPFDHLSHPVQVRLEEEIGQARGVAHAALTRAEHTHAEVRRLRAELNRQRPSR